MKNNLCWQCELLCPAFSAPDEDELKYFGMFVGLPGELVWKIDNESLPGFEGSGTIVMSFHFYTGIQGTEHPNPGNEYKGTSYKAYLPETKEGKHIFKLLRKAFDARLLFTIVSSTSDGTGCVGLKDIELKTSFAKNSR